MALTLRARADLATEPGQFGPSDWSVTNLATGGDIEISLTTIPSNGGSPLTAIEYQIEGGAWAALSGLVVGDYQVSGLADDVEADVAIRAVNAAGAGLASATKAVTPTSTPAAHYTVTNQTEWNTAIGAAVTGDIIEVDGVIPQRLTITGDFGPSGITIRGKDDSAELSGGILWSGTVADLTLRRLRLTSAQQSEGPFYGPSSRTVYGMFLYSGASLSNILIENCVIDGGADSFAEGGRMVTNNSLAIQYADGFTIRNCTIQRCVTGVYVVGSQNVVIEGCDISGQHADSVALSDSSGDCQDIIIRNNHVHSIGADASNFHADFVQFQPQPGGNWIRRVLIEGNTYAYGNAPFIAQADPTRTRTYNQYTASFSMPTSEHGMETRCAPAGGGTMTVTMPSAAGALRQYCVRQNAAGTVNFALNGADTWEGGTPQMTANGDYVTFVSDGTSQWKKLRPGFRSWFLLCTASRTLSAIEEGFVLNVDATDGDVVVTLPTGGTPTYSYNIRRIDNSVNTVTLAKAGGDTLTVEGVSVASKVLPQGYSLNVAGSGGAWTATEDGPTNQIVFGNAHGSLHYEDVDVRGNIFFNTAGTMFKLEQDVDGVRVYNNTCVQLLTDDQNGDGVVGKSEGNGGKTLEIDVRGADARAFANFTCGSVLTTSGDVDALSLGGVSLGATNTSNLETTYATYFNGTTRAAYRPLTRLEVINAALAKAGGPLDGTFIGACGTTASNGFYDFDTGGVNTAALPAPTIAGASPAHLAEYGPDGAVAVTFDQFVSAGTGNVVLRNKTAGTTLETFDVATGLGDNGGTISFLANVMTVTPGDDMPAADCALRIAGTCVVGHYDKTFAGIADDTTYYWTIDSGLPTSFSAVVSDGDKLTRSGTIFSSTQTKVLFGANVVRAAGSASVGALFFYDSSRDFSVSITSSGEVRVTSGGSSFRVPAGAPTSGAPQTILISVDMAAATLATGVKFYRNGVALDPATFTSQVWNSTTNLTITSPTTTICNNTGGTGALHGTVGFIYFDTPASLPDLDDSTVRASFYPQALLPANGANVTGSAPNVFLTGPASGFATNLGSGGNFTATGTFVDA